MNIKVCGITSVKQMQELSGLGINYAGIIFYPHSKRYATEKLGKEKKAVQALTIKKIGVFVNAKHSDVLKAITDFGLYAVQFHGDEDPDYCKDLMKTTVVIKAFRISSNSKIDVMIRDYKNACHFYLFDTATESFGGSGKQFNWNLLREASINKPFFLSGGISADDAGAVKELNHPFLESIDINSRFEIEPGVKNIPLIKSFLKELENN
jgi:phosphoribosylanthranilate isomerase